MKTKFFFIFMIGLLVPILLMNCSKEDSKEDEAGKGSAPGSVVGKSFIWKHNGYNDNTYTFNSNGTFTVKSVVDEAMNAMTSNSSYVYTVLGEGNATLDIRYTSTYKIINKVYTDVYNIHFVLAFYKDNSGAYSASETVNGKTIEKSGPFLLGKVGDVITDDSPLAGSGNCEQRQYIYDSMKKNLQHAQSLVGSDNPSVSIAAISLVTRIKGDMAQAKKDAAKAGCSLN